MAYAGSERRAFERVGADQGEERWHAPGYVRATRANRGNVFAGFEQERNDFPLQMAVILPEQVFGNARPHDSGERLLLIAVLEDAVHCYQRFLFASRQRHRRLFEEAERWIMERAGLAGRGKMCAYFTFERVCDVLGLDADAVRDRLLRWRERQLAAARRPVTLGPRRAPEHTAGSLSFRCGGRVGHSRGVAASPRAPEVRTSGV